MVSTLSKLPVFVPLEAVDTLVSLFRGALDGGNALRHFEIPLVLLVLFPFDTVYPALDIPYIRFASA